VEEMLMVMIFAPLINILSFANTHQNIPSSITMTFRYSPERLEVVRVSVVERLDVEVVSSSYSPVKLNQPKHFKHSFLKIFERSDEQPPPEKSPVRQIGRLNTSKFEGVDGSVAGGALSPASSPKPNAHNPAVFG
jgi:hypothetical protein